MSSHLDRTTLQSLERPTGIPLTAPTRATAARLRAAYFAAVFERWKQRRRAREALRRMSEREIRDFCASHVDAQQEMKKPFWRE